MSEVDGCEAMAYHSHIFHFEVSNLFLNPSVVLKKKGYLYFLDILVNY